MTTMLTPIITSREEFQDYQKSMLKINSIYMSVDYPHISLLLHTNEPRYTDFLRVIDDETIELKPSYRYILAEDTLYLACIWEFRKPAYLEVRFIIPVERYHLMLTKLISEEMMGLGFSTSSLDEKFEDFTPVMCVPSIDPVVILAVSTLDWLHQLKRSDSEAITVARAILE
jgi:hypothetical protein